LHPHFQIIFERTWRVLQGHQEFSRLSDGTRSALFRSSAMRAVITAILHGECVGSIRKQLLTLIGNDDQGAYRELFKQDVSVVFN
jgi:hypothetical protein